MLPPLSKRNTIVEAIPLVSPTNASKQRRASTNIQEYASKLQIGHLRTANSKADVGYSVLSVDDEPKSRKQIDQSLHQSRQRSWQPYMIRWPTLLGLICFNVAGLLTIAVLHWLSVKHDGLCNEDDSSALFFGWRFSPTLVAVVFTFLLMMLLQDVNRTEAYTRLASSAGSTARASLLREQKPWWSTFRDALPSRNNDHLFSLPLLCAVAAYVLGALVVSPFSATLLVPQNVTMIENVPFTAFALNSQDRKQLDPQAEIYFRTFGHVLQNVSTSAWVSDGYTVLPFWPTSTSGPPQSPRLSIEAQTWQAETQVFQSELLCEPMTSQRGVVTMNYTFTIRVGNTTSNYSSFNLFKTAFLESQSGCNYGFAYPNLTDFNGIAYWSNVSTSNVPSFKVSELSLNTAPKSSVLLNYTRECESKQFIVTLTPPVGRKDPQLSAWSCDQTYYTASMLVTAATGDSGETSVSFDKNAFRNIRTTIKSDVLNLTNFENVFLGSDWNKYTYSDSASVSAIRPKTGGPANLLAATYDFNLVSMLSNQSLPEVASKIKQRFFGEAILATMDSKPSTKTSTALVSTPRRRVLVVGAAAVVLEVVLSVQLCLLVLLLFTTRPHWRPLELSHEPSITNSVALMFMNAGLKALPTKRSAELGDDTQRYMTKDSQLHLLYNDRGEVLSRKPPKQTRHRRLSWTLSKAGLALLVVLLLILTAAIGVLYHYAQLQQLYQKAFVYQTSIKLGERSYGSLAPYSIIPTLIAVGIGLWWGVIDTTFRRIQPFVSMTKRPVVQSGGPALSYESSYILWASMKALLRRHWLLAIVCTGTFLSQISMSALWTKQPAHTTSLSQLAQPFQIRQIPLVSTAGWPNSPHSTGPYDRVLADLFNGLSTSWLYGAAIQLVLNGSQPIWSKDGWSFVPVDLSSINLGPIQSSEDQRTPNVVVRTPAIRARLECTRAQPRSALEWTQKVDLTNRTIWNLTANSRDYKEGYMLNLTNSVGASFQCCGQGTVADPGDAAIGIWKSIDGNTIYGADVPGKPNNLSISWAQGTAIPQPYYAPEGTTLWDSAMIWTTPPVGSEIICEPIIETANATITVDVTSARVRAASLDSPVPDPLAWTDNFVIRYRTDNKSLDTNVTTSYGLMFLRALLKASNLQARSGCGTSPGPCAIEHFEDGTYNIRRPGLNADYMSYAMLALANGNKSALLNPDLLISTAQTTFTTFFQHFASNNVSIHGNGGWVYQRVGAQLPADFPPSANFSDASAPLAPARSNQFTADTVAVNIERPVESLVMSPIAAWLCMGILIWLIVTALLVFALKDRYFSPLVHGIECLADHADLVLGSERYMSYIRRDGVADIKWNNDLRFQLGWFRASDGQVRWGIEVVEDGVEFLTREVALRMLEERSEMDMADRLRNIG